MFKHLKKLAAAAIAAGITATSAVTVSLSASADWEKTGYIGDLNGDSQFGVADLVVLSRYVLGGYKMPGTAVYDMDEAYYLTGTVSEIPYLTSEDIRSGVKYLQLADIDQDGVIDSFDLTALRQIVVSPENAKLIYRWYEDETPSDDYIDAHIYDLYGSMPSHGEARIAAFYVDFPDCRFSYSPSTEEIENCLFGAADTSSRYYPLESIGAFYERSSKGALKLSGSAYKYSAKKNISEYEGDVYHRDIINEVVDALDSQVDFSQFDGDGDGMIDAMLLVVPNTSSENEWWPAAGGYGGDSRKRLDGMRLGHIIVGNRDIAGRGDYSAFCMTYSHEMGHCMGLPDYYLYGVDDFQGMHGSGGFELMDDAIGDFGAASKLMLGWYTTDQVNVFDSSLGEQSYTLYNSETNSGNCVVIPRGDLKDKFRSEFFIIEYSTLDNNNMRVTDRWWQKTGSGVRIYHVEATQDGSRDYPSWKYASGNDRDTNYNQGKRFIRLVNEGTDNSDNLFRDGAVINDSTSGFRWYGSDGSLSVNAGITVSVTKSGNDQYTITVKAG